MAMHTAINSPQQMYSNYMDFLQTKLDEFNGQDFYKFERNQHEELKKYIGFHLFGQPFGGDYNHSQQNIIHIIYNKIFYNLDKFVDAVEISCVYFCVVSSKMIHNYITEPCLIVRKCQQAGSEKQPCSIVIDVRSDMFHSWKSFLKDNFYRAQIIHAPANALYRADRSGKIILETTQQIQSCLRVLIIADGITLFIALGLYIGGIVVRVNQMSTEVSVGIFIAAIVLTVYLIIRRVLLVCCFNKSRRNKGQKIKAFLDYSKRSSGQRTRTQCKKCDGFYEALQKMK